MKERPFKLGTTSFIYPDHIIPNVKKTGRFFDEIELLVFESLPPEVLPGKADVRELNDLARALDLSYNVHLPVDVSLTAASARERQGAADTLKRVLDLFAPVSPSTFTLHLDMDKTPAAGEGIKAWQDRACKGLDLLVPELDTPEKISVETLWYDPVILAPLVDAFNLSICADAGHHFKYGWDLDRTFDRFGDRISIVHLHGVDVTGPKPKDHIGLDRFSPAHFDRVVTLLSGFTGIVSLEVFNYPNLESSLDCLGRVFKDIPVLERAED